MLLLLLLNVQAFVLATEEQPVCGKNRTLLEIPGDAILTAFVNVNYGPHCNSTSPRGYEEVSTAVFVTKTLNKMNYVPGLSLGLKLFDTCHDETYVYKQVLQAAVDLDCAEKYQMGVLVPQTYSSVLEPIFNFSMLPMSTYTEQNITKSLINIMVHYIGTRFEVIDLVYTTSSFALDHFLDSTRDAGICVKNYKENQDELDENMTEAVIAVIGDLDEIRQWIGKGEKIEGPRKTWIVLPLDGSHVDAKANDATAQVDVARFSMKNRVPDLVPSGSYVIRTTPFDFDILEEFQSDDFLQRSINSVTQSPHLLGIGKAIIELTQVLHDIQKRSCSHETTCVMPYFDPRLRADIRNSEVYETLHLLPKVNSIKYVVAMRNSQDFIDVVTYKIEPTKLRIVPEKKVPKMPRLCLKKFAKNCENCANFQRRSRSATRGTMESGFLKSGNWIPISLTIVVCGTFACFVIVVFILYRYFVEEVLDGNPALTILLILGNVFTLQTVLPFCMNDDQFDREHLNSRKIFVTTLAFGLVFSVMLSRALFLAFSTGGVFTSHINGYLQGLMVFFMFGVQIAISTTYLALNTVDSSVIVRSLTFIALLGYDMFLLAMLFVTCCFIAQVQRNYCEGKCFFGTVIGLLIAWAVWVTCFILMEPETRDAVVSFGTIATAYLIIIGVLIPRTYYMLTHMARGRNFAQRYDPTDFAPDPRANSLARQCRPFYDYVHPTRLSSSNNLHISPSYPNYYGNSSPNARSFGRSRSPDPRRTPAYNNYGFNPEMREIDNSYKVPRVSVENTDPQNSTAERENIESTYARPRSHRRQKNALEEKDCIETDVYVEGRLSPTRKYHDETYPSRNVSPKLGQIEATICEEDEDGDFSSRITRF